MPLSDNEITALLKKAEAFAQSCNNDEALKAYDIIIEQEPDQARAWEGKGDALTKIDRHEDARTAYEKAAKCYKTGKDRARCYFNIIARFLFAIEVTKEIWSAMEDNLSNPP
jgi:tetratricopeptide (TPR) repeat protein